MMKAKLTPKQIANYITAYVLWIVVLLVAILLAIVGKSTLEAAAAKYYINDQFMHQMVVRFLDRAYLLIFGILWIILMVVVEEYFRNGVKKGTLIKRVSLVFGLEFFLLFIFDFALWGMLGWSLSWDRILILLLELLLGPGLLLYWRSIKNKVPKKTFRST